MGGRGRYLSVDGLSLLRRYPHFRKTIRFYETLDRMDEKEKIFVLEVNTIPGMTERSLLPKAAGAIGLPFGVLCVKILENTLMKTEKS